MNGKVIIVSAPSGAGKTSIVKHVLELLPELRFSISATTRTKRDGEVNGKDYHFLTVDDFKKGIRHDAFLEWEEVYANQFYGTLKSEIQRIWDEGKVVIFDVDVKGGLNIKKYFGDKALAIFVEPPTSRHSSTKSSSTTILTTLGRKCSRPSANSLTKNEL